MQNTFNAASDTAVAASCRDFCLVFSLEYASYDVGRRWVGERRGLGWVLTGDIVGKLVIPRHFFNFCLEYIDSIFFVYVRGSCEIYHGLIICSFCYVR